MIGYLLLVLCVAMIQNGLIIEVFQFSLVGAFLCTIVAGVVLGCISVKAGKAWYVVPCTYLVMYTVTFFMFSL